MAVEGHEAHRHLHLSHTGSLLPLAAIISHLSFPLSCSLQFWSTLPFFFRRCTLYCRGDYCCSVTAATRVLVPHIIEANEYQSRSQGMEL